MDKIDELLTRGVANIIPGKEELKKELSSGKKLNVYLGIDPTSTKIHLGHAVDLRKLNAFAELGHNVTFLIGDFTALIGDTSDKDTERPVLTADEIKENFATYKEQAKKVLDFSKITVVHNSEWLSRLTYAELIKIKQQFSLNDFISRELIKKRLTEGKSVRLDETEYPIMQGFDSYFLDTDIQLGGTDQTFNMQAGRTIQRLQRKKESYIIATEFLTGTDGRKMSKSWGNAIWLNDEPNQMYGKVMSIKDDLIIEYFTLATSLPLEEIEQFEQKLKDGTNPIEIKKKLAHQIVSELYSKEDADKAQEHFSKTVQNKELPTNLPIYAYPSMVSLSTVAIENMGTASVSEWKRLVEQGGVVWGEDKISDPNTKVSNLPQEGKILKVGKRNTAKIKNS